MMTITMTKMFTMMMIMMQARLITMMMVVTIMRTKMMTMMMMTQIHFASRSASHPLIQASERFKKCHQPLCIIIIISFISTEGAFRRPMTYDNHPIHPSQSHRHIELNPTSHELRCTK